MLFFPRQAPETLWEVHVVHLMQRLSPEKEKSPYVVNGRHTKLAPQGRVPFISSLDFGIPTFKKQEAQDPRGYFEYGLSQLTIACHFPEGGNIDKIIDYWMNLMEETIPSNMYRVTVAVWKGDEERLERAMSTGDMSQGTLYQNLRQPRHHPVVWTW